QQTRDRPFQELLGHELVESCHDHRKAGAFWCCEGAFDDLHRGEGHGEWRMVAKGRVGWVISEHGVSARVSGVGSRALGCGPGVRVRRSSGRARSSRRAERNAVHLETEAAYTGDLAWTVGEQAQLP